MITAFSHSRVHCVFITKKMKLFQIGIQFFLACQENNFMLEKISKLYFVIKQNTQTGVKIKAVN